MNTLEDRLRDAYQAAAETVQPGTVLVGGLRGADDQAPGGPPRHGRIRSQVLLPLGAAVAALVVIAGSEYAVGAGLFARHPGNQAASATSDVYLFNGDGAKGTLTPISPVTGELGKPVTVGPGAMRVTTGFHTSSLPSIEENVVTPDGRTDYVVYTSQDGTRWLRRVSLTTGAAGRPVRLGTGMQQITAAPDGKTLYVVNMTNSKVTPISTATNTPGKRIRMPGFPLYLAVAPDGRTIYGYDTGYGMYATRQLVTPISTSASTAGTPVTVKARGIDIVIAGAQTSPYVTSP